MIDAIQKAEEAQAAALGSGNLDRAVSVFAEDATLYLPNMPPARGHKAIKEIHERVLRDPALNVIIDETSRKWWISARGDLATTIYSYDWTHTDSTTSKPVTEHVVSQTTWEKRTDGSWKNVVDLNMVQSTVAPDHE